MRARRLSLIICCSVDEAVILTKELGPNGLYLILPYFNTPEEAEAAIDTIEKSC